MRVKQSTYDFYKAVLTGVKGSSYRGLRSYMDGFDAQQGFDLSKFSSWTKHQRAKVRQAHRVVMLLKSQPTYVFRARNPEHLRIAQESSHDNLNIKGLKVAFVKFSPPRDNKTEKPKIKFRGDTMVIGGRSYTRQFIPFDARRLSTLFEAEMDRIGKVSGAKNGKRYFTIQCGAFEKADVALIGLGALTDNVRDLMARYDGISIPSKRRLKEMKYGEWRPQDHAWTEWLVGVNVYEFSQGGKLKTMMNDSNEARIENRRKQKATRMKLARLKHKQKGMMKHGKNKKDSTNRGS